MICLKIKLLYCGKEFEKWSDSLKWKNEKIRISFFCTFHRLDMIFFSPCHFLCLFPDHTSLHHFARENVGRSWRLVMLFVAPHTNSLSGFIFNLVPADYESESSGVITNTISSWLLRTRAFFTSITGFSLSLANTVFRPFQHHDLNAHARKICVSVHTWWVVQTWSWRSESWW